MKDILLAVGWAEIITQALVFVVIGVVLPFVIAKANKYTNIKIDEKTRAYVETALAAGIRHGVSHYASQSSKSVSQVLAGAVSDPAIRSSVVGLATDYLERAVPDGLNQLGITGTQVAEFAYSRMDKALNGMSTDVQGTIDSATAIDVTIASGVPSPQPLATASATATS